MINQWLQQMQSHASDDPGLYSPPPSTNSWKRNQTLWQNFNTAHLECSRLVNTAIMRSHVQKSSSRSEDCLQLSTCSGPSSPDGSVQEQNERHGKKLRIPEVYHMSNRPELLEKCTLVKQDKRFGHIIRRHIW